MICVVQTNNFRWWNQRYCFYSLSPWRERCIRQQKILSPRYVPSIIRRQVHKLVCIVVFFFLNWKTIVFRNFNLVTYRSSLCVFSFIMWILFPLIHHLTEFFILVRIFSDTRIWGWTCTAQQHVWTLTLVWNTQIS